jgi:pyrrolidone-carboxylate peptidase
MARRARTAPSIDAGDYLCNQTLYASLAGATPVVTFLHVPRPANPRAPLRRASGRLSITEMTAGVVAAAAALALAARNGGVSVGEHRQP